MFNLRELFYEFTFDIKCIGISCNNDDILIIPLYDDPKHKYIIRFKKDNTYWQTRANTLEHIKIFITQYYNNK